MFIKFQKALTTIAKIFGAITAIGSTILLVWGFIESDVVGGWLANKIAEKNAPIMIAAVEEALPGALSMALINEDIRVKLDTNQILAIQGWIQKGTDKVIDGFPMRFDNRMAVWWTEEYPIYDGWSDVILYYARGIKVGGKWRVITVSVEEHNIDNQ